MSTRKHGINVPYIIEKVTKMAKKITNIGLTVRVATTVELSMKPDLSKFRRYIFLILLNVQPSFK